MLRSESIPLVPCAKRCKMCRCHHLQPLRRRPVADRFPRQRGCGPISLGRRIKGWEGWQVYLVQEKEGWCRLVQLGTFRCFRCLHFLRLWWVLHKIQTTMLHFHWTNLNCFADWTPDDNYQSPWQVLACKLGQGWRVSRWEGEKSAHEPSSGNKSGMNIEQWGWVGVSEGGEKENNIKSVYWKLATISMHGDCMWKK